MKYGCGVHGNFRKRNPLEVFQDGWAKIDPRAARLPRGIEDRAPIMKFHLRDSVSYFFKYKSKTCEVAWPASPVPWVSSGYLSVKTQCRCVERNSICASWSHLTVRRKKPQWQNRADLRRCGQSWGSALPPLLLHLLFFCTRASLISQLREICATRGHTSAPSLKYSPFTGKGVLTVSAATKCNITLSAHVTTRVRRPLVSAREQPSTRGRTFRSPERIDGCDPNNPWHPAVSPVVVPQSYRFFSGKEH